MIKERYPKHTFKMKMSNHPKYMAPELEKLKEGQFGFDAFGLKQNTKRPLINYLRGYKDNVLQLVVKNFIQFFGKIHQTVYFDSTSFFAFC